MSRQWNWVYFEKAAAQALFGTSSSLFDIFRRTSLGVGSSFDFGMRGFCGSKKIPESGMEKYSVYFPTIPFT